MKAEDGHGVSISNPAFCTLSKMGGLTDVFMCLYKRIQEKGGEVGKVHPLAPSFLVSISSRIRVRLSRPIHLLGVHFSRFDMLTPIMTVCELALANLAMWVRDRCFPASYAHATWACLASFFRLPRSVISHQHMVSVQLRPFNDRQYNRDLLLLCQRVNEMQLHLSDGRLLLFFCSGDGSSHSTSATEA